MNKFLSKIKKGLGFGEEASVFEEAEKEYVEIDTEGGEEKAQVIVRPFVLEDFSDIKEILDCLREGYTIALVNIKPIKEKDLIELKRAINKLKKTCDAIDGDIAGFGDDYIVCTPAFAKIHRVKSKPKGEDAV
ncbi:MAG: cell division protein SepF [Candidatus Woesearchaeota archaeon]